MKWRAVGLADIARQVIGCHLNSRHKGPKFVSMTWRAICAGPYMAATFDTPFKSSTYFCNLWPAGLYENITRQGGY